MKQAEKKYLKQMDEKDRTFRSIASNFHDVAYRLDQEGKPLFLFGGVESLTGYREDELTGNPMWKDLMLSEDREESERSCPSINFTRPGYSCNREYRITRKNGEVRWVHDYTRVLEDGNGNGPVLEGVLKDITDWKQMEQVIRKSEQQARQRTAELTERIKELNCLHEITALASIHADDPESFLEQAVHLLPGAWQYPDIARARIEYLGQAYLTPGFRETGWMQTAGIKSGSDICGSVTVAYLEQRPLSDEGPFLREERLLIDTLGLELGKALERHEFIRHLRESEQWYSLLIQSVNLGLWDWNPGSESLYYNPVWKAQVGYEDGELENKFATFETLLHPDDKEEMLKKLEDYLENPAGLFLAEFRLRHKKGHYVWISTRAASLTDANGKVSRMFGANTDVTEKKQAEKAVRESEERFRHLFENAKDMIHIVDGDGIITHVNQIELNTLEYNLNEMIGSRFTDYVDPEYLVKTQEQFSRVKRGEHVELYQTVLLSKSGQKIHSQVSVVPEFKDGFIKSVYAIIRDVTDLRRKDRELANANQQLIEKNRELEQIVYVTSHDLRSPLVNIQGFNQELVMSIQDLKKSLEQIEIPDELREEIELVIDHEVPESLDFIRSGIHKIDNLLKGLLTISRLGRRPMEIGRVDVNRMVNEIIKTLHYQINEKHMTVMMEDLPACIGDETRLNQAFSNLLDNAVKFMDKHKNGTIRISGNKKENQVLYRIEDNGPGIPRSKHEKIFEIFHKHESVQLGEGLGLTIVRKIIEKHHGHIGVDSSPGQGSAFTITLPQKQP